MPYTEHPIHKEIVDTFFRKSTPKKQPDRGRQKKKHMSLFIVLTAVIALAFFVIISILYIRKLSYHNHNKQPKAVTFLYSENILKNGSINRGNVGEVYFKGDAKAKSSLLKNSIRLVNSVSSGEASFVIKFRGLLNFDGKNILLLARTEHGINKVRLALKDSENRIYISPNMDIATEWGLKHIFMHGKTDFDLKHVKEMELEFGRRATGNKNNSVIYIKNLTVRGVL